MDELIFSPKGFIKNYAHAKLRQPFSQQKKYKKVQVYLLLCSNKNWLCQFKLSLTETTAKVQYNNKKKNHMNSNSRKPSLLLFILCSVYFAIFSGSDCPAPGSRRAER
ncbi:50S ribosomal protein L20 [Platysternon megacephalum]|uniref:50S ribosomal protein L20 n=1 Tax=Platysternon megacephalum TaxID=55544 RepID=A0A4D9DFQ3_9SAUR|nr:50S ribosomal protein L20 [Platysternon megacephalum]